MNKLTRTFTLRRLFSTTVQEVPSFASRLPHLRQEALLGGG